MQDILQKGGTRFDAALDKSDTFDFELFKEDTNKPIIETHFIEIGKFRILTENGFILNTEDNF